MFVRRYTVLFIGTREREAQNNFPPSFLSHDTCRLSSLTLFCFFFVEVVAAAAALHLPDVALKLLCRRSHPFCSLLTSITLLRGRRSREGKSVKLSLLLCSHAPEPSLSLQLGPIKSKDYDLRTEDLSLFFRPSSAGQTHSAARKWFK